MHRLAQHDDLPNKGDQLLTVKDIASRLQMSESLVYQLIEKGEIACHRVGHGRGRIRVSEEDLCEYLIQCRHLSSPAPHRVRQRPQLKHLDL